MSRMLEISTQLGGDAFLVQRFSGREELGRLYEYQLELLSERGDITAEQLLGTNVTIALERDTGQDPRYFNGYITSFSIQGVVTTPAFKGSVGYLYLATVNPGLWFRTRSANSQIFSQMAIADIIAKQIQSDALLDMDNKVTATEKRDFVVQYRETDFNFISRLAEHAGIYYYFTHTNGKHKIVLLNSEGDHPVNPDLGEISFSGASRAETTLSGWRMVSQVRAGAFSTGDYNYVTPNTSIAAVNSAPKPHDNAGVEIFDFPVDSTTAEYATKYAQIRQEEEACRYAVAHGSGVERNIQVGFRTALKDHAVAALNMEYLVIGHSFAATNNLGTGSAGTPASFHCEFEAIPASVQFRSAREIPRPFVAGTQTALVAADFRTDTDTSGGSNPIGANLGRVKVQFFWDRYSKQSCWARVSTPWAGKGYGFQNMPRVGEEVLVQFIEGDPDRPVVIGRVHNAENMPPFKLPALA